MELKKLTKEQLYDFVKEYSNYVTEYCDGNDIQPVCVDEFYNNDYQEIPHKGDKVKMNMCNCDDDDLFHWFHNNCFEDNPIFEIVEVDYYGSFNIWLKGCPFAINPDIIEKF